MPTTQPLTVPSLENINVLFEPHNQLGQLGHGHFCEDQHVHYPLSLWGRRHRNSCSSGHRRLRVLFVSLWDIEGRDKREGGCQQIGRGYVSLEIIQEWASLKPEPNEMSSRQNNAPTQQISIPTGRMDSANPNPKYVGVPP